VVSLLLIAGQAGGGTITVVEGAAGAGVPAGGGVPWLPAGRAPGAVDSTPTGALGTAPGVTGVVGPVGVAVDAGDDEV
jgi:hypothetical protein